MGQIVTVRKIMTQTEDWPQARTRIKRWIHMSIPERPGWVVGVRYLQTVKASFYEHRFSSISADDGYTGPTVEEIEPRQKVLLICFWPTETPRHVHPDDISLVPDFPYRSGAGELLQREMRQQYRDYPEYFPRDAKGRFIKSTFTSEE